MATVAAGVGFVKGAVWGLVSPLGDADVVDLENLGEFAVGDVVGVLVDPAISGVFEESSVGGEVQDHVERLVEGGGGAVGGGG